MNTQEHLDAIKRHIVGLLAIAEKRTPGEWRVRNMSPARHDVVKESGGLLTSIMRANDGCREYRDAALPDATFIASAAGNFEAALRSTLAAIDFIEYALNSAQGALPDYDPKKIAKNIGVKAWEALQSILAEWPIERITGGQEA